MKKIIRTFQENLIHINARCHNLKAVYKTPKYTTAVIIRIINIERKVMQDIECKVKFLINLQLWSAVKGNTRYDTGL